MALSIKPKSEVRKVNSMTHGYGEIPFAEVDGKQGFALPGGRIVFDENEAIGVAKKIDKVIRSNIIDPRVAERLRN